MICIYHKKGDKIFREYKLENLASINPNNLVWIDLIDSTEEEKSKVELLYKVNFQSETQIEEIESSSRFLETDDFIIGNSNFLVQDMEGYSTEPVSFILKDNFLISYRYTELHSFTELIKKFDTHFKAFPSGYHVVVSLFEIRIDFDADILESIARDVSRVSKLLSVENNLDNDIIIQIAQYQETIMMLRENIVDKQRVISAMLKSEYFPRECNDRLRIIIKDISSLLEHTAFAFERLEYLQNTFIGLLNIEQNKIIKIFTVASVVFMPPTLIASIYGMNFNIMPELGWNFGYPFAITLMILSSFVTLLVFRKKKWL
jgi:magnesium transporter